MQKICGSCHAILACVIIFVSILDCVPCLPLDNPPSLLHRDSFTSEDDSDITSLLQGTHLNTQSRRTSTTHNFYWWQVERASGVEAVDTLDREKRFPRIPIGEQCRKHTQCSNSHCCAMKLGMPVCRRRPITGQPCQLYSTMELKPDTSQLFTFCPCADGLTCGKRSSRSRQHPMNTRCSSDNDCSNTHCCAMKLGMAVCRTRPSYGQNCKNWTALDTDALFTLCPCAEGYTCRRIRGRDVGICHR